MRRSRHGGHILPRRAAEAPAVEPQPVAAVFLRPGEAWTTDIPTRVKTVLGSCVAITMRAPRLGLASVTHCLLPSSGVRPEALSRAEALKYVDATVGILIETFASRGAAVSELEVKLIGGADNLQPNGAPSFYSVGERNVRTALDSLAERGIAPAAAIVGGRLGRVMVFDTATGDVFVKQLSKPPRSLEEEP